MPVKFHPSNPIDALEKIIVKDDGSPLYGEITAYKKLFTDLTESKLEWDVWHDLKLPYHSDQFNYYKKTSAQLDFLVLCREGIIVLEIKGGAISTITQATDVPANQGFGYSHKIDVTTADAMGVATDECSLKHQIEAQDVIHIGYGTSTCQTVTLSDMYRQEGSLSDLVELRKQNSIPEFNL